MYPLLYWGVPHFLTERADAGRNLVPDGEGVGHFGDLTCRVCVEMGPGTVMPSQNIAGIGGSPATEGHSPAYGTV